MGSEDGPAAGAVRPPGLAAPQRRRDPASGELQQGDVGRGLLNDSDPEAVLRRGARQLPHGLIVTKLIVMNCLEQGISIF